MTKSIIITAGGIGKRMGSDIPKQFIEINGLPILMRTIQQFFNFDNTIQIIVVLPEAHIYFWNGLIQKYHFTIKHTVIKGGKERFHSIKNGLTIVNGDLVGIHDGVRPFVSIEVIKNTFNFAQAEGAAIPVIDLKESIRQIITVDSKSVDRSNYKIVQTPQCFTRDIILKAYQQDYSSEFTDDASVVEQLGHKINLVPGNDENIKITTPMDLRLSELLIIN
jgi:2-C-methyl-D-erythritol 4-phosphate cytidylyltransferase